MSMSQTHALPSAAAAREAETARSAAVEAVVDAGEAAERRLVPEAAGTVAEAPMLGTEPIASDAPATVPFIDPEAPALDGQAAPSRDEIEMSAQAWWQANVQTIIEGPGTTVEKAEVLQQISPSPDPAERVVVRRDGQTHSSSLEVKNDAADRGPVHDPAGQTAPTIGGREGVGRDATVDQTSQRNAMLKAAEQIRGQVAELLQQLDRTGIDQFGSRMEIGKRMQSLEGFADRIEMAASKQTLTVDLSREEIDYGPDVEAGFADGRAGVEHVPAIRQAESDYEADLEMIEPALTDLARAGIEVTTGFQAVEPPEQDHELDQDEGLEVG